VKKIILVGLVSNPRFAYVRRMTENWRAINLANWESLFPTPAPAAMTARPGRSAT
jgi:hypothetical protein